MINCFTPYLKRLLMNKKKNYRYIELLFAMTKNDLKSRFVGNFGGILWAFIQPCVTIVIFWFVFTVGFKSAPINDVPFILWLIAGMIPWFFFSEAFSLATSSIKESSFLVKKILFEVSLLPLVKIISALIIHIFFIFVMIGMYILYGFNADLYWLQIGYYFFASIILVIGLSLISSSIMVFFKDMGQFVAMSVQFGFWLTPIFWTLAMVPDEYKWIFKLNPMYYITQGYRDCFIDKVWFWEKPLESFVYWIICLSLLGFGIFIFAKLRPHFADVL